MTGTNPVLGLLAGQSWPEVAAGRASSLLVVPVGSLEQHGPHLPLDTDTRIAGELAARLVRRIAKRDGRLGPPAMLAPPIAYGASGEHAGFPGTLSIGSGVLEELVVELVRSARASFAAVLLLSGHGGNAEALRRAARRSRAEGDRVVVAPTCLSYADAHAGRTETSVMLAIDPGSVRLDRAVPGRPEPLAQLLPSLRAGGVRSVSANGVLGDPTGANGAEGRRLLAQATRRLGTLCAELAGGEVGVP